MGCYSSSDVGRRPVCHFDVMALEVFGRYLGDAVDDGEECPSRSTIPVGQQFIRRCIGDCVLSQALVSRDIESHDMPNKRKYVRVMVNAT